nr:hypothetical protein [Pyrolobus fumarii]
MVTGYDLVELLTLIATVADPEARKRVAEAIADGNAEAARRVEERMVEYVASVVESPDPLAAHVAQRVNEEWYARFAEFIQEPDYMRFLRRRFSHSRRSFSSAIRLARSSSL